MREPRFGLLAVVSFGLLLGLGCEDRVDWVARRPDVPKWVERGACSADGGQAPSAEAQAELDALWQATAERTLCVCEEALFGGAVDVEARGEVNVGALGMNIERDGAVAGDLLIVGALQASPGLLLQVGADLWVGRSLMADGATVRVGGEARVGSELRVGTWEVAGRWTMPPATPFLITDSSVGEPTRAAVPAPMGCACDPLTATLLDTLRADARVVTVDDAGVVAHCGLGILESSSMMTELRITGAGVLIVDGRTAVEGDVWLSAEPGMTLDIILTEDLHISGSLRTLAGGQVRVYLASTGNLHLTQDSDFSGLLAMPAAELLISRDFQLHGSALVRRLFVEGGGSLRVTDD